MKGKILAICRSDKKGTQKYEIQEAHLIPEWGIEGDAHAGRWHRQVSLLSFEKIEEFRAKGANVSFGAFGENLVLQGVDLRNVPVGTIIRCGDAVLRLTQIGKECHEGCEIRKLTGKCVMPTRGIFTRVLSSGTVKAGDVIIVLA